MNKKLKILELYGGIGAPREALERVCGNKKIDIKSIDYVEICEKAVRTYNEMFEHLKQPESVIGYNLQPDVLVHGSPCQTFSNASNGKWQKSVSSDKKEYLDRLENNNLVKSDLFWETLRIIDNMGQWRPPVVIWENVPSVLNSNNIESFNAYISEMEGMGYTNYYEILAANDFGIPQSRKRMFCISLLSDKEFKFENLKKKQLKNLNEFLETDVDDRYVIKAPSMKKAISDGKMKILDLSNPYEIVPTITTKQNRWNVGVVPIGKNEYRLLTEKECWRLMGFSDYHFECASRVNGTTALYQQAGNSIVVDVLVEIFEELFKMSEFVE